VRVRNLIAAIVAIAALFVVLVKLRIPIVRNEDAPSFAYFESPRGERRIYSLPDSSSMMLAAASTARFTGGKLSRLLDLDGEALLRVHHDSSRTFIVNAGNAVTSAVGTEFVVRAYRNDSTVDVAVVSGAVMVKAASDSGAGTRLSRGQVARVESSGATIVRTDVDAAAFIGWAKGKLIFSDVPVSSIAAELSRWFKRDIVVTDTTLAKRHITATYDKPSLDSTLAGVARLSRARVEKTGNAIRLSPE
jgi:transmembrane sensor